MWLKSIYEIADKTLINACTCSTVTSASVTFCAAVEEILSDKIDQNVPLLTAFVDGLMAQLERCCETPVYIRTYYNCSI